MLIECKITDVDATKGGKSAILGVIVSNMFYDIFLTIGVSLLIFSYLSLACHSLH